MINICPLPPLSYRSPRRRAEKSHPGEKRDLRHSHISPRGSYSGGIEEVTHVKEVGKPVPGRIYNGLGTGAHNGSDTIRERAVGLEIDHALKEALLKLRS